MDVDDNVCETTETVFPSKEDSDHSGEEHITEEADADVKYAAAVNDSTGKHTYVNCAGQYKNLHTHVTNMCMLKYLF